MAFIEKDDQVHAPLPMKPDAARILVFFKTRGYYHPSISLGIEVLQKMGAEKKIIVDTTADASLFTEDYLKNYRAVIFLSTTLDVLNSTQQVAFQRYIQAGGGFAGVHSAADTEHGWAWYSQLVGAQFNGHPRTQKAIIRVTDKTHLSTSFLPDIWERTDEWYNFKNISPDIKVLASLDEKSYEGGTNGSDHPIAWYHEFDGGRSFYTGGGHTDESYSDSIFLKHLWGGIAYAMGSGKPLDWNKSYAVEPPEENRFTKKILANDLNEPMELTVASDGRVFYVERTGNFFMYDPRTGKNKLLRKFPVVDGHGNGLLGITLDPDFLTNNWIYFFYTPVSNKNDLTAYVSRFSLEKNILHTSSEKILLRVPLDYEGSAHIGGSLTFDSDKHLFIGIGDNTTPSESGGFSPLDERPGRNFFDAQRSAANTADLRGKILRIHPEKNGTYTIPDGNLFTKDGSNGRPEIYVMGCRNPYRISVDPKTSYVYWGEVGPDGGKDGSQGPRGYDEFNQAKKPGNYGWPYFIGNNIAYHAYNFATEKVGESFDVNNLRNNSINNTGKKELPPPQKAMIWYPYVKSEEFPELGMSGRCAMGGPVYHYNKALVSRVKFPAFYDNCLFVYDWMRNWVKVIRFDEQNNYKKMESFLAITGDFKRPVDIEMGADGAMYMLEYGSVYGVDNEDARLVKIEYNPSNRKPVAKIHSSELIGEAPFKVHFNGESSYDPDGDDLDYTWLFDGKTIGSTDRLPMHIYAKNGSYRTILRVKDKSGLVATDTVMVSVGNTMPQINIETTVNQSFYWDNHTMFKYNVHVSDKEDKQINPQAINISYRFNKGFSDNEENVGNNNPITPGEKLIAGSDCKACHTVNKNAIGPSFSAIASRYKNDPGVKSRLINKIINGGGGVWGNHYMSAHPQLSEKEVGEMVKYILSLSNPVAKKASLPQQGQLGFKEHTSEEEKATYALTATYTDAGANGAGPLTQKVILTWRNPRIPAINADQLYDMEKSTWMKYVSKVNDGGYLLCKDIDLTHIKRLTCEINSQSSSGKIEVRTGSPGGTLIGSFSYEASGDWNKKTLIETSINPTLGKHSLYFVIKKEKGPDRNLMNIHFIEFHK